MITKTLTVISFILINCFMENSAILSDNQSNPEINFTEDDVYYLFNYPPVCNSIVKNLDIDVLENMSKVDETMYIAKLELRRRPTIMQSRNGMILPTFLREYLEQYERNFTCKWIPNQAIVFGDIRAVDQTILEKSPFIVHINSQKGGLEISRHYQQYRLMPQNNGAVGSGAAFIFPRVISPSSCRPLSTYIFHSLTFSSRRNPEQNDCKLGILFVDDTEQRTSASMANIGAIYASRAPFCIVSQPRHMERKSPYEINNFMLLFKGPDVEASTFATETEDEKELNEKLQIWKSQLNFLITHQIIAFHFTKANNGMKPENSEQAFRRVFPDVPINTLHLHDDQSIVGVQHPIPRSSFQDGLVYAVVGMKKFIV